MYLFIFKKSQIKINKFIRIRIFKKNLRNFINLIKIKGNIKIT